MKLEELIQELRIQKEVHSYLQEVDDIIIENFDEENQEKLFNVVNKVLENEDLNINQKLEVIDNLINEMGFGGPSKHFGVGAMNRPTGGPTLAPGQTRNVNVAGQNRDSRSGSTGTGTLGASAAATMASKALAARAARR